MTRTMYGLIFIAWLAFVGWLTIVIRHSSLGTVDNFGDFGDSFGVLNALFAAGAVISVLFSLKFQNEELHRQRFEASYFQLLELLRELRLQAEITVRTTGIQKRLQGNAAVTYIYNSMKKQASLASSHQTITKKMWADWYDQTCDFEGGNTLGPYFRVMYNMLARVSDDGVLSKDEKIRYGNLLRGQLSTNEIGLVGWNGLTRGSKNFSEFVEEFRLLKYLHEPNLKEVFKNFYKEEAFSGR